MFIQFKCDLVWNCMRVNKQGLPKPGSSALQFPTHPALMGHVHAQARPSTVPEMSSDVNAGMAPKASDDAGPSHFPKTFVLCLLHTVAHHSQPVAVASLPQMIQVRTILVLSWLVLGLMGVQASSAST